jgi:RimJ/RimL family protein N-acetyltransferase
MHIATQSVVTTERLTLRQLCHDELTFITELLGDAEVTRFHQNPYTPEEAATWLNQQLDLYKAGEPGMWLVLNQKTGKPVGVVGAVATAPKRHLRCAAWHATSSVTRASSP